LQREPPGERFIALPVARERHILGDDTFAAMCAAGAALGYREALAEARRGIAVGMAARADGENHAATR
jgi:hypothetical protein